MPQNENNETTCFAMDIAFSYIRVNYTYTGVSYKAYCGEYGFLVPVFS